MRLIDADEAKKLERMLTLKPSERALFRLMLDRMPTYEPPNPPLTVDELREMDGMPVWVCEPNGANGVWGLVDLEYQMIRLHGGGLAVWENNDKSWLAYRRKPEEVKAT